MTTKYVTLRMRAFSGRLERLQCRVDDDGTVRPYDSVAGHYTTCHSLTTQAIGRVRAAAARQDRPERPCC